MKIAMLKGKNKWTKIKEKKIWKLQYRYLFLFLTPIILLLSANVVVAQNINSSDFSAVETIWLLIAGALVFFMNAGFALLEAGFCRKNNAVNVLAKNLIVFCVAILAFWLLGFSLMFGDGINTNCLVDSPTLIDRFLGRVDLAFQLSFPNDQNPLGFPNIENFTCLKQDWPNRSFASLFFFQLVFAGTAATIVSGAVAERIKFLAFFLFSFFLVLIIYPLIGQWIWGHYGWLNNLGFKDFAGSTVVHSVGGTAALTGAIILKPRWKNFNYDPQDELNIKDEHKKKPPQGWVKNLSLPSNLSFTTLGCLILWLGWLGFNGGSTSDLRYVAHIVITTIMASATGGIATIIACQYLTKNKPTLGLVINGILGGLVGITASSAYVDMLSAIVIGFVSGCLVIKGEQWLKKLKIDDPVGAIPVHLICGGWGTCAVGIFSNQQSLLYNPSPEINPFTQFAIQLIGWLIVVGVVYVLSTIVWIAIGYLFYDEQANNDKNEPITIKYDDCRGFLAPLFKVLRRTRHGIRVSIKEEEQGSDGLFFNREIHSTT